jgi:hypothetical protein
MAADPYPEWQYYPLRSTPPPWVHELVAVVEAAREFIDTSVADRSDRLTSDAVLTHLSTGLRALGYEIEVGKGREQKIRRPVLYGPWGRQRVAYEVDAVHDPLGIVLEVEAGRGAQSNAVHRDLIRASLIVDARFLALGVARQYRFARGRGFGVKHSYREATDLLDALYGSGRLILPFEGLLLFGY